MSKFITWDYQVVAALHDIIEDTTVKGEDLIKMGIPEYLVSDVETLSRNKEETYKEFIERVCRGSTRVKAIKLSDLEDNMRFDRNINGNMYNRYIPAWKRLKDATTC